MAIAPSGSLISLIDEKGYLWLGTVDFKVNCVCVCVYACVCVCVCVCVCSNISNDVIKKNCHDIKVLFRKSILFGRVSITNINVITFVYMSLFPLFNKLDTKNAHSRF